MREKYLLKCRRCGDKFESANYRIKLCPCCDRKRKPKNTEPTKKPLTFAEILRIAEIYNKIHHKYLHYGDIVALVDRNVDRCVCCGAVVPEGRQVCPQCEKAVN